MYGRFSKEIDVMSTNGNWPEDFRNAAMEKASQIDAQRLAYGLYMAECEGYLDTRESKINKMLKDFQQKRNNANYGDILIMDDEYLSQFGLTMDDLTEKDYAKCRHIVEYGRL